MAYSDIQFWSGSSTFDSSSGETPFGFYDTDTEFISEIDSFANWAAKKLGYPARLARHSKVLACIRQPLVRNCVRIDAKVVFFL